MADDPPALPSSTGAPSATLAVTDAEDEVEHSTVNSDSDEQAIPTELAQDIMDMVDLQCHVELFTPPEGVKESELPRDQRSWPLLPFMEVHGDIWSDFQVAILIEWYYRLVTAGDRAFTQFNFHNPAIRVPRLWSFDSGRFEPQPATRFRMSLEAIDELRQWYVSSAVHDWMRDHHGYVSKPEEVLRVARSIFTTFLTPPDGASEITKANQDQPYTASMIDRMATLTMEVPQRRRPYGVRMGAAAPPPKSFHTYLTNVINDRRMYNINWGNMFVFPM